MLAVMSNIAAIEPPYRVQCPCPVKKFTIQLYTASGISSEPIFWNNAVCLTVSKALLKSTAKTTTYGLVAIAVQLWKATELSELQWWIRLA